MKHSARLWIALALMILTAVDIFLGRFPAVVAGLYLIGGGAAFLLYGFDKRAAQRGDRRIPERMLHLLDMAFGIAGGLLGQEVFRHKTAKPRFALVTWAIAGLHATGLALLMFHVFPVQAPGLG